MKVDGTAWETLNLGVEYQRIEPDFQSIANPYFVRDREGVTAMANTPWGPTRYTLGFSWAHDNLRNDPLLPRIEQKAYMASWALQIPDYPSLMLNYNRSEQGSMREPTGFAKLDTLTDAFTGALSYSQPTWNATLNGGYSLQDNRKGASPPDTSTWNALLAFGVRPTPNVNVAPSFGFTRSKDRVSDVTRDTYLATLTSNVAIVPE